MTATLLCFIVISIAFAKADEYDAEDGYYRREHSLVQPYQGSGVDIPFWEFGGSTVVTSSFVKLTPDRQSKKGSLWNIPHVQCHNWEVVIHFHVHGQGKNLFGDGFAFWYTKEKGELGPVFGNRDYFTGLGVFYDTYSNQNGAHVHDHPYISALVNNGSLQYDHDRDGTHSQVAGCTSHFRGLKKDTFTAISYINRELVVLMNIVGEPEWQPCFSVPDIDLPTGYHFGITAETGDLADNHDIVSVRVYELDGLSMDQDATPSGTDSTQAVELDWSTVMPHAGQHEPQREHMDDIAPVLSHHGYYVVSMVLLGLLVLALLGVAGFAYFKKERGGKRYF